MRLLFDTSDTENKERTFDSLKQQASDYLTVAQAFTRNPIYSEEYSAKAVDGEAANLDYLAFLLSSAYENAEGIDPRSMDFSRQPRLCRPTSHSAGFEMSEQSV